MEKIKGIIYVILSSAAFGVMPIFVKLASNTGMSTFVIIFFRFFFAAMILLSYLLIKKVYIKLTKEEVKKIILVSFFGSALTSITLFFSYNYIPVGMATTLHFFYPIIVTILALFMYKEKLYLKKVVALAISVLGICLLIGCGDLVFNITGIVLALLSAIFYSIYILGVSNKVIKTLNIYVSIFYISIFSSASIFIIMLFNINKLNFKMTFDGTIYVLCIAIICTVVALMAFLRGVQVVGPSSAAILSTFEPIVSIILGVIIFKEPMSFQILLGCVLVLVSVVMLTVDKTNN